MSGSIERVEDRVGGGGGETILWGVEGKIGVSAEELVSGLMNPEGMFPFGVMFCKNERGVRMERVGKGLSPTYDLLGLRVSIIPEGELEAFYQQPREAQTPEALYMFLTASAVNHAGKELAVGDGVVEVPYGTVVIFKSMLSENGQWSVEDKFRVLVTERGLAPRLIERICGCQMHASQDLHVLLRDVSRVTVRGGITTFDEKETGAWLESGFDAAVPPGQNLVIVDVIPASGSREPLNPVEIQLTKDDKGKFFWVLPAQENGEVATAVDIDAIDLSYTIPGDDRSDGQKIEHKNRMWKRGGEEQLVPVRPGKYIFVSRGTTFFGVPQPRILMEVEISINPETSHLDMKLMGGIEPMSLVEMKRYGSTEKQGCVSIPRSRVKAAEALVAQALSEAAALSARHSKIRLWDTSAKSAMVSFTKPGSGPFASQLPKRKEGAKEEKAGWSLQKDVEETRQRLEEKKAMPDRLREAVEGVEARMGVEREDE